MAETEAAVEKVTEKKLGALVDRYLGRFISRKLTVFMIGCLFLFLGKLQSSEWIWVASIYIGSQAVIDAALAWKNGRRV
jgi:hypothetical protein